MRKITINNHRTGDWLSNKQFCLRKILFSRFVFYLVVADFSICWCWLRIAILLTCTGIGTTIFGAFGLAGALPAVIPAFTRFHLARRFWNHIFTCTSLSFSACAIWDLSVKDKYFFEWNSFSSSSSCSLVKAVRFRRVFPPPPGPRLSPKGAGGDSAEHFPDFVAGDGARSSVSEESLVREESVRIGDSSPKEKEAKLYY